MEQVKEDHCYRNKRVVDADSADKTEIILVAGEVSWMVLCNRWKLSNSSLIFENHNEHLGFLTESI